ncbi:hypothetical protein ACA910_017224 [Epithemia clementina (nom. ined.)]
MTQRKIRIIVDLTNNSDHEEKQTIQRDEEEKEDKTNDLTLNDNGVKQTTTVDLTLNDNDEENGDKEENKTESNDKVPEEVIFLTFIIIMKILWLMSS